MRLRVAVALVTLAALAVAVITLWPLLVGVGSMWAAWRMLRRGSRRRRPRSSWAELVQSGALIVGAVNSRHWKRRG